MCCATACQGRKINNSQIDNLDQDIDQECEKVTYFDVGDFIEQTFETCLQYDRHCWFMVDVLQSEFVCDPGVFAAHG